MHPLKGDHLSHFIGRINGINDHEPMKIIDITEFQSARKTSQSP
jgi:hypothetical protein